MPDDDVRRRAELDQLDSLLTDLAPVLAKFHDKLIELGTPEDLAYNLVEYVLHVVVPDREEED